jgi:hypothetical protein
VWPAIGWGCYVGSGWTWVIGMLLPALLLRDFGVWGWFAFAVPNVLGAAAMGYVLTAERSERVAGRHLDMGLRFSEVTIAYHGFVLGWLFPALLGWWSLPVTISAMVALWVAVRRDRTAKFVAATVSVVSLVALAAATGLPGAWKGVELEAPTRLSGLDLALFVPASVLGFLLCPYLDLSFHRARQATADPTGRLAFALGFGAVFLLMIVGSLMYGGEVLAAVSPAVDAGRAAGAWAVVLGVHLVIQTGFTLAVHAREGTRQAGKAGWWRLALVLLLGMAAGLAIRGGAVGTSGLSPGEVGYRLFLLAYAVPFPAYVWLCMIPTLRAGIPPRVKVLVWAIASVLAFIPAYAAFIDAWSLGIPIAVGVLLLARLVVERLPSDPGTIPPRAAAP